MNLTLKPAGKHALWIGSGALVGLALGALLTDAGAALPLAPLWLVLGATYVAGVFVLLREKGDDAPAAVASAPARATPAPRAAPASLPVPRDEGLQVFVDLPDVPEGFPAVVGERETIRVAVSVQTRAGPAQGSAVRLAMAPRDGPRTLVGEGVTGGDGTVLFDVHAPGVGELVLEAEARREASSGSSYTTASVVRYEEEIARLFGEFRSFAVGLLGAEAEACTARELAERLRVGSDATTARALLEIARIYELVAYGERDADRRLYLALMQQLMVLERADLPTPAPAAGTTVPTGA